MFTTLSTLSLFHDVVSLTYLVSISKMSETPFVRWSSFRFIYFHFCKILSIYDFLCEKKLQKNFVLYVHIYTYTFFNKFSFMPSVFSYFVHYTNNVCSIQEYIEILPKIELINQTLYCVIVDVHQSKKCKRQFFSKARRNDRSPFLFVHMQ